MRVISILGGLAFCHTLLASTLYTDRESRPDEAITCFRTLVAQSESRPLVFIVFEVKDQTGIFGVEGSPPMELTMVLKHALASLHERFTVRYVEELKDVPAGGIVVQAAIVEADINNRDQRAANDASIVVGGGDATSSAEGRRERFSGQFSGKVQAIGYQKASSGELSTHPKLTSEISFSATRSQAAGEWAVSIGPFAFGKSSVARVNGSPHAVFGKAAELLAVRLVGKASSLPYWRCTERALSIDHTVMADIRSHFRTLSQVQPAQYEALQTNLLASHGYGPTELAAAQLDAVRNGCESCGQDPIVALAHLEANKPLVPGDVSMRGHTVPEPPRTDYFYATRGPTQRAVPERTGLTLLSRVEPVYPVRALRARREAVVRVRLDIDRNGYVVNATVLNDVSRDFANSALRAVRQYSFTSDYNGEAIRYTTMAITFRMAERY